MHEMQWDKKNNEKTKKKCNAINHESNMKYEKEIQMAFLSTILD